jgi:WD40 repeat protein
MLLATSSQDYSYGIKLWSAETFQPSGTLLGHHNIVSCLNFSRDGSKLASGSYDTSIRVWDVLSQDELITLSADGSAVVSVNFSPDGQKLCWRCKNGLIRLWDTVAQQSVWSVNSDVSWRTSVCFSADSSLLFASYKNPDAGVSLKLYDAHNGTEVMNLSDHSSVIACIAVSPLGDSVATGSSDKTIIIWT